MSLDKTLNVWVLTDGKAGDLVQCEGVCEAMGLSHEARMVNPRWFYRLPFKFIPVDPQEREDVATGPLSPPMPDLVIASGRRAAPYLRRIKALSPQTFTVFLKDPRTGPDTADFIWVPAHDRLRGDNVMATPTSPHRVSAAKLAASRAAPPDAIARLPRPRVAVLIGGDSAHMVFSPQNIATLAKRLDMLAQSGVRLMGSFSRRSETSNPRLKTEITAVFERHEGLLWDGNGANPYIDYLANADGIVVTTDSVNMVGEAVATGAPVMIFRPSDRKHHTNRKIHSFLDALAQKGALRSFTGRLETLTYEPIDSTPQIAREITARLAQFRAKPTF